MHRIRVILLAALVAIGVFARAPASGDEPRLTIKQASIGFAGKYKAGFWQPIQLTIVAGSAGAKGQLEISAPDGDQTPVIYRDDQINQLDLQPGQQQTLLRYAKTGPIASRFTVLLRDNEILRDNDGQLRENDSVVWSQELPVVGTPLASTAEWIVALGTEAGLTDAIAALRRRDSAVVASVVSESTQLPDRWWAYSGIDVLLLTTRDRAFLDQLTPGQRQAIIDWVLLGGRLIFSCGDQGTELAAASSPWSVLLPGELESVEPLRDRTGLENFSKSELPFDDPTFQRNRPLVTRLKNTRGEVLLGEQGSRTDRPLAIRAPAGLGQITFVGFDLDHPSLVSWKGRPRFIAALLSGREADRQRSDHEAHRSVTHLGYEDLVGQLRAALDQFSGVSAINFTTVALLIVGYLLIAAPGDYFALSRGSFPRHWTWLTFPAVITATIAATAYFGRHEHGSQPRLNQVEIVDIDLAQQIARGTTWAHVYSPKTTSQSALTKLNLPASLHAVQPQGWLTWQGLPGDSLGGLESQQPALTQRSAYLTNLPGEQPRCEGFVIPVASAKSLSGRWWTKTNMAHQSKLSLDRYGLLAGEFQQPLDIPLEECLLAHGEKLYRLGALQPGQRFALADFPPLDLEARLTQRRIEQSKDVATPWDKASTDVPRIVQMLLFHEAARGKSYTGLSHRYQSDLDLSDHIRLGQAVLLGRAKQPASTLVDPPSNQPLITAPNSSTYTWYRLIIPVKPRAPTQLTTDN